MKLPKIKTPPKAPTTRREFGAFLKGSTTSEFSGTYCIPDPRTAGLIDEISGRGSLKRIAAVSDVEGGRAAGFPTFTATLDFPEQFVAKKTPTDFLEIVGRDLGQKFFEIEAEAYTTGDGGWRPRGIYDYGLRRRGKGGPGIGFITPPGGRVPSSDDVYNLIYAVTRPRRRNGTFVCSNDALPFLATLTSAGGNYHFEEARGDECARLFGFPCRVIEGMQSPEDDAACPVAFGDFRAGYKIELDPEIRIWRFNHDGRVLIQAERALQAGVDDGDAFSFLKFTASRDAWKAAQ